MIEHAKQIVIAMIENGYIAKNSDTAENVKRINMAIDSITKQLVKSHNGQFDNED